MLLYIILYVYGGGLSNPYGFMHSTALLGTSKVEQM